jgi:hypothetical protein
MDPVGVKFDPPGIALHAKATTSPIEVSVHIFFALFVFLCVRLLNISLAT